MFGMKPRGDRNSVTRMNQSADKDGKRRAEGSRDSKKEKPGCPERALPLVLIVFQVSVKILAIVPISKFPQDSPYCVNKKKLVAIGFVWLATSPTLFF